MLSLTNLKGNFHKIKYRLRESNLDNLIWIVNIVPSIAGFSVHGKKIGAPYWIIHLSMLFYVYGLGCLVYQLQIAISAEDYIKNFVNVSLLILIFNICWWWLSKRPLLLKTLQLVKASDTEVRNVKFLKEKYMKMLSRIKYIILIFYMTNYMNATFIYLPHRVDISNDYSMAICVGLEPLTSTPNREICLTVLFLQEIAIMVAVLNYQAMLLLLIAHTSTMFHMLSEEIMAFNEFIDLEENKALVKNRLPLLIRRHVAILSTCDNLKALYSLPIGVDFGSNAVCLSIFLYLPIQEWLKYFPILIYCILSFFLYCFLCQSLTSASEVFERAVYSCGWENFDINEKKLIYVMLRQTQKSVILLAADIIPVNMYTFATTLQGMFKFVTVVKL